MSEIAFQYCDELGPSRIVHMYEPETGLKAILVVDNVAAGPAIGGTRMAEDVSLEECFRLARAMTLKNAMAGLPHGGGKSVIFADPLLPAPEKERLMRAFARGIEQITDYIPGPDMGTNETCMAWVNDTIGRGVGLPRELGGIPLDEIGATGYGLMVALEVAQEYSDVKLRGARVVVQGFGCVGMFAARFLASKGAVLVAASDIQGAIVNEEGINVESLIDYKRQGGAIQEFPGGKAVPRDDLIGISSDIWIPAARPDVIDEHNVDRLDTRIVAQGANIPCTLAAEEALHQRGILVLPDFVANAGGVICASVEYQGGSEYTAMNTIADKIGYNTRSVLDTATETGRTPRSCAVELATNRVNKAMGFQRRY
jgi:glutamate dehydrogenase/leucine dehydrogenase